MLLLTFQKYFKTFKDLPVISHYNILETQTIFCTYYLLVAVTLFFFNAKVYCTG